MIGYAIWIGAILLGWMKRYSKVVSMVICLVAMLLFSQNTGNADYIAYELNYSGLLATSFEPGYDLLVSVSNSLGLDYRLFRLFYILATLIIYVVAISRLTNRWSFVLACYLFIPFWIDAVQMRMMMAGALITLSFSVLVHREGWRASVAAGISVLIAASFHTLSLFFLVFLLFPFIKRRSVLIVSSGLGILIAALMIAGVLPELVGAIIGGEKAGRYFLNRADLGAWLAVACTLAPLLLMIMLYRSRCLSEGGLSKASPVQLPKLHDYVCKLAYFFIPVCVLYFVDVSELFRVIRASSVILFCIFSVYLSEGVLDRTTRFAASVLFFMWLGLVFFAIMSMHTPGTTFIAILENNSLLNGLTG